MKVSSIWLSDLWTVQTKAYGESEIKTLVFDIHEVTKNQEVELPIITEPANLSEHYTIITLTKLSQNKPRTRQIAYVKKHLASIYSKYIREGILDLVVNGELLEDTQLQCLIAPYYKTPNGEKITWRREINFVAPKYDETGKQIGVYYAKGFIGILEKMSTSVDNGILLFRRSAVFYVQKLNVMNSIEIFKNESFGEIRVTGTNDQPLFCLADLCKVLELTNPSEVKNRLDKDDVQLIDLHALNSSEGITGNSMANFVTESGFYDVILQSSSPRVKPFRKWVTSEVLPAIRKNGGYMSTSNNDTPEEIMARAVMIAQETIKRREQRIEMLEQEKTLLTETIKEAAPKVEYFDKAMSSKSSYTTTQVAQEFGLSAKTLNARLAKMGVQYRQGGAWILYAKYQGNGYTHTVSVPYMMANGEQGTQIQTRWTEKGRKFLHDLLDNK